MTSKSWLGISSRYTYERSSVASTTRPSLRIRGATDFVNSLKTHHHERPNLSKLRALFGIDSRSLALFRMAAGTLLLIDLSIRCGDLTAMYSDQGVLPIAAVRQQLAGTWYWSLHFLHGSSVFQAALFVVAAILAIALLFGFYTRIATIGSWIMLASIYTRAPYAVNGGDTLLVILLFWSMFLPLGKTWSIDACRGRVRSNRNYSKSIVLSMGTCAIPPVVCCNLPRSTSPLIDCLNVRG